MITVWLAQKNSDLTEGRGYMRTIAAFATQNAARTAAKGWGVMGVGNGEVEALIVYDDFREWEQEQKNEIRNKALAKLTPDERRVLGV